MKQTLIRTLSGRAIVVGAVAKIIVAALGLVASVPSYLRAIDTIASVAIAAGGVYFISRAVVRANERLLWRVRRKLIISYIFIGFIPAFLIVAFFLLVGLILFSTFSSYLVQNRLQALGDRLAGVAEDVASDVQRRGDHDVESVLLKRQTDESRTFPNLSMAVVPLAQPCRRDSLAGAPGAESPTPRGVTVAGAWTHAAPPADVPAWVGCEGFRGLLAYSIGATRDGSSRRTDIVDELGAATGNGSLGLLVRAIGFPRSAAPGYAVVMDLIVDDEVRRQLRNATGVELQQVTRVAGEEVGVIAGKARDALPNDPPVSDLALPLSSVSFLAYRDWNSGRSGTLLASLRLSVFEIYDRISATDGAAQQTGGTADALWPRGLAGGRRSFGQGLMLVLISIGALFLIIEFVAFVTGLALARSITGSVHELFAGTERVRRGDFTYKIAIRARDQLGELAASFNSMTASIGELLREAAEKKRLEEELRIAHEIQMSLLPSGPLSVPGVSVSALCVPAREVGGDYYDFLPLDDQRLGVLIADVSGKGTSAALYMAELKGLILSLSRIHSSPRSLLIEANRIIAEHLDARSFITMTYAIVDLRARTMTYARAGHTPLMHLPRGTTDDGHTVRRMAPEGLVLGLKLDRGEMFERLLQEETVAISSGDLYVFFTDGITEAMDDENDCFGETRLERVIEEHAHLPSDQLRERVLGAIRSFVGRAPQHDDMTLILLRIGDDAVADAANHAEAAGALRA
jgi:serine phosphatase RsbU (regulator of sigma subunit)